MPELIDPRKYANAVKCGFDRMKFYRRARAMFIKGYVGKYYAKKFGLVGDEPINLLFHTIRAMVPSLIMKSPVNEVTTQILDYQTYAFLMSLGLNQIDEKLDLKNILRYGTVDAMFGCAIFKTGLANSGDILTIGDVAIDRGQVYTDNVSLDDYVFDPSCKNIHKPLFEGHRNRVPRQLLLDDDRFDHDLVVSLPSSKHPQAAKKVEALTQSDTSVQEIYELQDFVDVVETYIPEADAIAVIADPEQSILDNYLALYDYYGPDTGPYIKMALTQPVPDNPFPVAPASVWYDMHYIANKVMYKLMMKADRQRDIAIVDPAGVDEYEDIRTSEDGDAIIGNPETVKVVSYGGVSNQDAGTLAALKDWYNYISGNPDQMSGQEAGAKTATGQSILQGNMNVGLEDLRDIVYDTAAKINRSLAWFLHTDPLIELPLIHRKPGGEEVQLILTPEQRRGDFLDFYFNIKQRSMSRLDPTIRAKRIMEFATNVIPGLVNAAMICMQMGVPFNLQRSITDIADEMGVLEEVGDWFDDPEFMQRIQLMMAMGPQNAGKASANTNAGVTQNNGFPMKRNIASPGTEMNQNFQMGANPSQSNIQGAY